MTPQRSARDKIYDAILIRLPATPRQVEAGKPIWYGAVIRVITPRHNRGKPVPSVTERLRLVLFVIASPFLFAGGLLLGTAIKGLLP